MKILKNREEIIEKLTEMLIGFDKSRNEYQTDVYLYYDAGTQTATLDTFVNVGGNSWLNDDHETIYSDREHYEDFTDFYCDNGDFAWGLDMSEEDLEKEALAYYAGEYEESIDYYGLYHYITTKDEYLDKLYSVWDEEIEDRRPEYEDRAEYIISEWETYEEPYPYL